MSDRRVCFTCGELLRTDDVAIYLKLVSRAAREYQCIGCLGEKLKCGREPIEQLIRYYRESGNCVLFR
ncbi:hypothetical protein PA598K_03987 [Paenibacillus sp. 598K]|uniref:hypothetical protein n=1 Tax=Paenibacillus sp. 598K TaxID=1117987 RepID=UPI000FF986BA|nr:hypothetical protein [Paenibacillus sp. 598K]GBF75569.1 hypothetical protein PA598K_03987 [Paenibacillus sp. 598K]